MTIHWSMPCDESSLGDARLALRSMLTEMGTGTAERDAALLVMTELLTNAIVHADQQRQPIEVVVACTEQQIHIEVMDHNPQPPIRQRIPLDTSSGRGLAIVDELTSAWGWRSVGEGNRVWCDLPRQGASPAR